MIFGMPAVSFMVLLSWPVTFMITAVIIYQFMKKQDEMTDDTEFDTALKNQGGGHA